ncbi:MORN-repeat protein [Orpheovirus IHUMI-LCC2]|uniref:MORN-repeat protein n=1 Tax=Orpheovirus IHUMI-LCC2 TaxID=2023057 RepID=A0A2I2L4P3_9VIRU|nr:MORN-repeat protein [Orpheovirus IHUMI-LCC2]SNW62508.1 MORN-repeat protein [Orpheovirus IHUMI-LCC2]
MNIFDISEDVLFNNICYYNYEVAVSFSRLCKKFNRLSKGYNREIRNIRDYFLQYIQVEDDSSLNKYWINKFTNKKEGKYLCFNKNGIKLIECIYENDKLNGVTKEWGSNGNILVICSYKHGDLHGRYSKYLEDFTLMD